ncbi:MAG: DnaD domain protein [Firmicutes bacterium]|nr:DnaD domain protein [Bacillota bacterium]
MGFIRFNKALNEQRKIVLDTAFILEDMPYAPEGYAKVYLAGLAFASSFDNELEGIALALNISMQEVMNAYAYWQSQELVQLTLDPPSVEYAAYVPRSKRVPKFDKAKYKTFNDQLHLMLKDRQILPNEYNEYYTVMELDGVETEAMLIIIAYCVRQKGESVRHPYITTVARNLAAQGYRTYERVNEHLSELELLYDKDLKAVLKALRLKRKADYTDKRYVLKWQKELGFPIETIVSAAGRVEYGGVQGLDKLLIRYYENRIFTVAEVEAFEQKRDALYALTGKLAQLLGSRLERYDSYAETYVAPWLDLGFSESALKLIAEVCFSRPKYGMTKFESMNQEVARLARLGKIQAADIKALLLKESAAVKSGASGGAGASGSAVQDTVVAREGNPNFVSRALTAEELNAMFERLSDDEL